MKSDILFFNPPQTKNGVYLENRILLWLASYLKRNGFNTKVFYLDSKFKETIARAISYYQPKYIAVSCKWYTNLYGAILVASEIRKIDKSIRIITGGNTATYFDRELLLNSDFDIVIRGDAELSLLNIMKNKPPINCTLTENGRIKRYKLQYTQRQQEVKDYTLVEPGEILESPKDILGKENFVWTGRGCTQNCFYCAGSSTIHKKMFQREKLIYRQIKNVLADIAILSKYSKSLIFDFACLPRADAYYLQLFKCLPQKKLSMTFFHWSLPSRNLVDQISKTFKSAVIFLDTSTLCEELREALSQRNLLKPFFSNKKLEDFVFYCNKKKNIELVLTNIAGLPGERGHHVRKHINFSQYLIQKYPLIQDIHYLPLSIEPGSLLQKHYKRFNMYCSRNNFMDFLNLTCYAFKSKITYPFSDFFKKLDCKIHPYGLYDKNSSKKVSYARERNFYKIIKEELRANRIICNSNFRRAKISKSIKQL
jgi:radical SAM superfamily enzyme YgiQ (UPF0313 family)